jgi:hypothetical protein
LSTSWRIRISGAMLRRDGMRTTKHNARARPDCCPGNHTNASGTGRTSCSSVATFRSGLRTSRIHAGARRPTCSVQDDGELHCASIVAGADPRPSWQDSGTGRWPASCLVRARLPHDGWRWMADRSVHSRHRIARYPALSHAGS